MDTQEHLHTRAKINPASNNTHIYIYTVPIQFSVSNALPLQFTSISDALCDYLPWPFIVKLDIMREILQGMPLWTVWEEHKAFLSGQMNIPPLIKHIFIPSL